VYDKEVLLTFLIEEKDLCEYRYEKAMSACVGFKDYHYESEKRDYITYHYTYLGGVKFIGEKVRYCGSPAMNWI